MQGSGGCCSLGGRQGIPTQGVYPGYVGLAWLLAEVPWQHDEIQLYGKRIVTARRVAWYGDEAFDYRYSGVNHRARLWALPLRTLRDQVSARVGTSFNSCLLNMLMRNYERMISLTFLIQNI